MFHHCKMHWYHSPRWRRKWPPTTEFILENRVDRGGWWAAVHGGSTELDTTAASYQASKQASNAPHSHNVGKTMISINEERIT